MNTKKDRESIQGTCDLIKIISKSKTKEEQFKKKKKILPKNFWEPNRPFHGAVLCSVGEWRLRTAMLKTGGVRRRVSAPAGREGSSTRHEHPSTHFHL